MNRMNAAHFEPAGRLTSKVTPLSLLIPRQGRESF